MSNTRLTIAEAIENRRSLHLLSDEINVSDERVREMVAHALLHAPTPFHCQSGRAVVLTRAAHKELWDLARSVARAAVDPDAFEKVFRPRIDMFRAAYGTILFYESGSALEVVEQKMPMIRDKVPQWPEHSNGMLQYALWTVLTAEGLGVNLQHYNPMIDSEVAERWGIPADWSLKAQMVFGRPAGPPLREKVSQPVDERMMVFSS